MTQFLPQNFSAIVAYQEWMDNKKVGKYDLNKYSAVQARDFPNAYELNSIARQACAQNEHDLQSPDSTTTVKKEILVKKDIHSSRKIAALLSISQPDANLRQTENQSI